MHEQVLSNIMRVALIPAAGRGSRLGDITSNYSKCLLDIGGKNILERQIYTLNQFGVDRIIVIGGYQFSDVSQCSKSLGAECFYNPFWSLSNVISSLWVGLDKLNACELIFAHGDTVFSSGVLQKIKPYMQLDNIVLPYDARDCEHEEMKVFIEDGKLKDISKTMDPSICHGEFPGIAYISPGKFELVKKKVAHLIEKGAIGSFFEAAIKEMLPKYSNDIEMVPITGERWWEIDTPDDLDFARKMFGEET